MKPKIILIPDGKVKRVILIKNVIYCKSDNCYTEFFINGIDKPLCMSKNLKSIEQFLPKDQFVRSHQSYLINVDFIDNFQPRSHIVKLKTGKSVKLSRRMYQKLRKSILENLN